METKTVMGKEYRKVRITIPIWIPVDAKFIGVDKVSVGSYPDRPGSFTSNGIEYWKGEFTIAETDDAPLLFRVPQEGEAEDSG